MTEHKDHVDAGSARRAPRARSIRRRTAPLEQRALRWFEPRRSTRTVDLATAFYHRDRDQFAAVLGAAIALRLFLFMVPAVITGVGLITAATGAAGADEILQGAGVTGSLASEVSQAAAASRSTWLAIVLAGLPVSVWAGRNLAKVLAVCSGAAWQLGTRDRQPTMRTTGAVTALAFVILTVAALTNRIRSEFGIAVQTTSWVLAVALFAVSWYAVLWALPRATRDPAALLPGAVMVGVVFGVLQWFMQFYLPSRLDRAQAVAGGTGVAVATLGGMFLIGRAMASSFILNAVVYERIGSIAGLVFALPGLRQIPRRFPAVTRWFDLDDVPSDDAGDNNW
jgi:uncharacterized BrkB/YihY/UPF0761 family membrane protein